MGSGDSTIARNTSKPEVRRGETSIAGVDVRLTACCCHFPSNMLPRDRTSFDRCSCSSMSWVFDALFGEPPEVGGSKSKLGPEAAQKEDQQGACKADAIAALFGLLRGSLQ